MLKEISSLRAKMEALRSSTETELNDIDIRIAEYSARLAAVSEAKQAAAELENESEFKAAAANEEALHGFIEAARKRKEFILSGKIVKAEEYKDERKKLINAANAAAANCVADIAARIKEIQEIIEDFRIETDGAHSTVDEWQEKFYGNQDRILAGRILPTASNAASNELKLTKVYVAESEIDKLCKILEL